MVEGVLNVQVVEKDASEESKLDESCAKIIDQNMKSTKWETMGWGTEYVLLNEGWWW